MPLVRITFFDDSVFPRHSGRLPLATAAAARIRDDGDKRGGRLPPETTRPGGTHHRPPAKKGKKRKGE
jgi:hypothetical protein